MSQWRLILGGAGLAVAIAACGTSQSANDNSSSSAVNPTSASSTGEARQIAFETDHFAPNAIVGDVATEDCTLSGGTVAKCATVTIAGYPTTYQVGPFCPTTITTPAKDAGIWFDGSGVYDLDGLFIQNLATFYNDPEWKMYDDNGEVKVTDTKDAFDGAARPDVDPQYQNHCVEGQLAWLPDGKPVETTMSIPLNPVKAAGPSSAHPGNLGVTLDGVVIAESAPVDAILGAHTIAAFDDCGGHYNPIAGYHMHGVIGCGHLEGEAVAGETQMFGYAADGYPINLPLSTDALAAADLDECNGHTTAGEGYHYHAQDPAKNAILPCLMGEYVSQAGPGGQPQGGGQGAPGQGAPGQGGAGVDLAAIAQVLGVTEHELEDAMATGDIDAAAELLGLTAEEMANKLGMSVDSVQAFLQAEATSASGLTTPRPAH